MTNTQKKTTKLAKMAMLVAISIVLVALVHFPIFPMVAFLEYDPADIPILIGTFAFGPAAGIMLTVVTSVLQGITVSAQSGVYGIIMHILATTTLTCVAGTIYRRNKTKKSAIIGLICGTVAMTAMMFCANLVVTPFFMGTTRDVVMSLMPFILAFNAVKAGINSVVTFIVYKRISAFLHR